MPIFQNLILQVNNLGVHKKIKSCTTLFFPALLQLSTLHFFLSRNLDSYLNIPRDFMIKRHFAVKKTTLHVTPEVLQRHI